MRVDPLNYEQSFSIEVSPYKDGIVKLANDQRQIIIEIQQAFELFGQGVLYDERRGTVHKMDGTFPRQSCGLQKMARIHKSGCFCGTSY